MSIFSEFKTDSLLETEGVEIDYIEFKLKLRRAGGTNKKYALAFAEYAKAHKTKAKIDEKIKNDVMLSTFVDACYVEHSWYTQRGEGKDATYERGIENEQGELVAGTRANVKAILAQLPDLFDALLLQAQDIDIFKRQQVKATVENLENT